MIRMTINYGVCPSISGGVSKGTDFQNVVLKHWPSGPMLSISVGQISIFWTNEFPNIFVTIDIGRMNIQIYLA